MMRGGLRRRSGSTAPDRRYYFAFPFFFASGRDARGGGGGGPRVAALARDNAARLNEAGPANPFLGSRRCRAPGRGRGAAHARRTQTSFLGNAGPSRG